MESQICTPLQITCGSKACGNMCGDVTSTTSGVVQSRNFPGDYGNENRTCYITITAPAGWMIQLNFTTFNVETDKAFVAVGGDLAYLLPGITGNKIPRVVATTNTMDIGFQYYASDKPTSASEGTSCSVQDPGKNV
ncbi:hypothetical protein DAPPUDRAFT_261987 [Daphnia pulex]|uniref:CUB domain-containing protein n=1 Tax=Daphnia pulex TaxID=6669 RepID=E9HM29_DAPPU|nr:hypothetical protein DAPPUDRAFT_261987 [Daphnia pulex]|eukprot:EFX67165.1 hypothetical protein DAPPUDRAFT_261987 [Daphnia pulex]